MSDHEVEMPAFTYAGRKPEQNRCDECGEPTNDNALCHACAWHRWDDHVNEWNGRLRDDVASWGEEESA